MSLVRTSRIILALIVVFVVQSKGPYYLPFEQTWSALSDWTLIPHRGLYGPTHFN